GQVPGERGRSRERAGQGSAGGDAGRAREYDRTGEGRRAAQRAQEGSAVDGRAGQRLVRQRLRLCGAHQGARDAVYVRRGGLVRTPVDQILCVDDVAHHGAHRVGLGGGTGEAPGDRQGGTRRRRGDHHQLFRGRPVVHGQDERVRGKARGGANRDGRRAGRDIAGQSRLGGRVGVV